MELILELEKIQDQYGYLPRNKLDEIAETTGIPIAQIVGVANFYSFFCFEPDEKSCRIERIYRGCLNGILLTPPQPYPWVACKKAKESPEDVLEQIRRSALTGRSGSNFPTSIKWETALHTSAEEVYVVCNADEGEPGTGKDRILLEQNRNAVVEGMAVCASVIGAQKGFIYLRGEYEDLLEDLQRTISDAPLGNFTIEVRLGHGAYICGEETALLESLENKRGETRLKPPFPGISGYRKKPTVIHNAETFACIAYIAANGADSFCQYGTKNCTGTRLYTVCGDVEHPGVYEMDAGISVKKLLKAAGGMKGNASPICIQVGGGSGALFSKDFLEASLTPDDCTSWGGNLGTASVRFLSANENLLVYVRELVEFYSTESCGMCIPCRNGLGQIVKILKKAEERGLYLEEAEQLRDLSEHICHTARCAMARAAVTPVRSLLENFPEVMMR